MARKKSQKRHLLSTAHQRKRYFYVRNFGSLLIGAGIYHWANEKMASTFAVIIAIVLTFIFYKTIAHYIALLLCGIEEFLGG